MSRWTEMLGGSTTQGAWTKAKTAVGQISFPKDSSSDFYSETRRLEKVVSHIDKLIDVLDPDLAPLDQLTAITGKANNIINSLNNFASNKNIAYLQQANEAADSILKYLAPYTYAFGKAATAAGAASRRLTNLLEAEFKRLEEEIRPAQEAAKQNAELAEDAKDEAKRILQEIQAYRSQLLEGSDEEEAISKLVKDALNSAQTNSTEIEELKRTLLEDQDDELSVKSKIDKILSEANTKNEEIAKSAEGAETTLEDLRNFYDDVYGKSDDEGNRSEGLKEIIAKRFVSLDDFESEQKDKLSALNVEIEGLLPGATSAGLASAYEDRMEHYKKPILVSSILFYASLAGLFVVALLTLIDSFSMEEGLKFADRSKPLSLLGNIIYRAPLAVPFVWLALFASKRRSQNKRLHEEYAHKAALARSYQSFKLQAETLDDEKSPMLLRRLLAAAIENMSNNPSATLDGNHDDHIPLHLNVNQLNEVVEAVSKRTNP